jgi:hypothetical protein
MGEQTNDPVSEQGTVSSGEADDVLVAVRELLAGNAIEVWQSYRQVCLR